jgi:hypothetical protein
LLQCRGNELFSNREVLSFLILTDDSVFTNLHFFSDIFFVAPAVVVDDGDFEAIVDFWMDGPSGLETAIPFEGPTVPLMDQYQW